jgi:hypothetical protein
MSVDEILERLSASYESVSSAKRAFEKSPDKQAIRAYLKTNDEVTNNLKRVFEYCKQNRELDALFRAEMMANKYDIDTVSTRDRDRDASNKQLNETNGAFYTSQTVNDPASYKALRSNVLLNTKKDLEKAPADSVTAYFEKRLRQLNLENAAKLSPERYATLGVRIEMIKLAKAIYNEKQINALNYVSRKISPKNR